MGYDANEIYFDMQSGNYESFRKKLLESLPDVGRVDLNEEHMGLLSIFFSFQRTMEDFRKKTPGVDDWEKVAFDLQTLIDFVERHLSKEEELMRRCGHSYLTAHIAEHNVFRRKLKLYLDTVVTHDTGEILRLKYDMFEWFIHHISITDLKYKADIPKV